MFLFYKNTIYKENREQKIENRFSDFILTTRTTRKALSSLRFQILGCWNFMFFGTQIYKIIEIVIFFYELIKVKPHTRFLYSSMTYMVKFSDFEIFFELDF